MRMQLETATGPTIESSRPLTGWGVLGWIGLLFGAMFIANGALVYYALSTFSGEEEASPYEHGLAYDRDIAAARTQDALGWRVSISARRVGGADGPVVVDVIMRDAHGEPVRDVAVVGTLEYPANKALDQRITTSQATPGEYRAEVSARAGQWDIVTEASRDGARVFRSRNRIDLP